MTLFYRKPVRRLNDARASRAVVAATLAASLLLTAAGCSKKTAAGPGEAMGTVKKGELTQRVTVAGSILPKRRTVIYPPYNGYIRKVFVKVGDQLKSGDPVVSLAQSLIGTAEIYPIRSPFAGKVVQVLHEDGEYVSTGGDQNVLVRIDDLSRLYVLSDVPEMDLPKIREGQEVVIRVSAILGRTYKGVIREIAQAAREKKEWSRTSDKVEFTIRIEVTDADERIKPGMSALVDVIAAKREHVLTLKHEFIQKSGDKYVVILADGSRREIEVGLQNEEMFEIKSGLKEGDRVKQVDFLAVSEGD